MPSSSSRRVGGLARLGERDVDRLAGVEVGDDAARDRERVAVVRRVVVGDARAPRVHVGAAELLGRHHLAGRRLHQRRAAEEDRALVAHDHGLVRHRRHVGAARRARAHHHGDLRDAGRRQRRLVVEDAAEMLAIGKHLGLVRQVGAAGIDQIDAGQPVLARDLLRAQMLLHRHRQVGAALDGRVVGDDHAFAPFDAADAGDDAGAVDRVVVHAVGGERRELEERRAGVDQRHHAIARQQLAAREVPLARALRAAGGGLGAALLELGDERAHARRVGAKLRRGRIDAGRENRHDPPSPAEGCPGCGANAMDPGTHHTLAHVLVGEPASTLGSSPRVFAGTCARNRSRGTRLSKGAARINRARSRRADARSLPNVPDASTTGGRR